MMSNGLASQLNVRNLLLPGILLISVFVFAIWAQARVASSMTPRLEAIAQQALEKDGRMEHVEVQAEGSTLQLSGIVGDGMLPSIAESVVLDAIPLGDVAPNQIQVASAEPMVRVSLDEGEVLLQGSVADSQQYDFLVSGLEGMKRSGFESSMQVDANVARADWLEDYVAFILDFSQATDNGVVEAGQTWKVSGTVGSDAVRDELAQTWSSLRPDDATGSSIGLIAQTAEPEPAPAITAESPSAMEVAVAEMPRPPAIIPDTTPDPAGAEELTMIEITETPTETGPPADSQPVTEEVAMATPAEENPLIEEVMAANPVPLPVEVPEAEEAMVVQSDGPDMPAPDTGTEEEEPTMVGSPEPVPESETPQEPEPEAEDQLAVFNEAMEAATVYFGTNSDYVRSSEREKLDTFLETTAVAEGMAVDLVGFADSRGDPRYNRILSERRANNVAEILEENGIQVNEVRVEIVNSSVVSATDRRVELRLPEIPEEN